MPSITRPLSLLLLLITAAALAAVPGGAGAASASEAARGERAPAFGLARLPGLAFESPVWVGGAGDGSAALYVVEQRGVVWKVVAGRKQRFLDLRRSVLAGGEQGLLSIAFARDFATSGRMFTYFTAANGNGEVRQFRVRAGRVVSGSGRVVIRVPLSPPSATNHNGGALWTTPGGQLFLSIGDGGGSGDPENNAQRLGRLAGKLIRITPRPNGGYVVPRSNPYVGRRGARPEVYALGLRNPWRFSIDGPTGDIWIGDVGQGQREEVDRLRAGRPAGANFGWRRLEGTTLHEPGTRLTPGTPYVGPFLQYGHDGGGCSVTGGVVYRGPVVQLRGWYLYADYCTTRVSAIHPRTRRRAARPAPSGIVHFGAGQRGQVYVASHATGRIYRVVAR